MKDFPTTIISVSELQALLQDEDSAKNIVILDASIPPVGKMSMPEACWPKVSLPNAKRFDINGDFRDPNGEYSHMMATSEQFNQAASKHGISDDENIVIYDCFGIFSSPRAWWMFKAMGHKNVAVLDGGLPAWLASNKGAELRVSDNSDAPKSEHIAREYNGRLNESYFINWQSVQAAIDQEGFSIVDARAALRFSGEAPEPREGMRSGHIPSAISLPYSELLASENMFKPKEQLKAVFAKHLDNVDGEHNYIFSCGSGVTACVIALAADIIGLKNLSVYDGSWSEWGSRAELPLETG